MFKSFDKDGLFKISIAIDSIADTFWIVCMSIYMPIGILLPINIDIYASISVHVAVSITICIAIVVVLVIVVVYFMHFTNILGFSLIHKGKIHEDIPLKRFFVKDLEHFLGGLAINDVTIFGYCNILAFLIVESHEVFVVDILDINPLNLEVPLEF